MPHRGSLVFTPGRRVQFEMVMRAKTRLEAEIVKIKLEGQDLARNLHDYKGRVSVVEANLEMPSVHDEDHMEMEMYLREWQWVVNMLRKNINDLIDILERSYDDLDLLNHQLAVFG